MSSDLPLTSDRPAFIDTLPVELRADAQAAWDAFRDSLAREALPLDRLPAETPAVWAWSPFIAKACARRPRDFSELLAAGDLSRPYADGEMLSRVQRALAGVEDEEALMRSIRQLRNREMLRIAWRDLLGAADLRETLGDLTDLAEHCVDRALAWLSASLIRRYGVPRNRDGREQGLVVLGMGKLGGRELNFSSDIDLIFAYPESGSTDGERVVDNQQFFTRLGQRLIKVIGQSTADGFVFRVDMRLRPFGDSGPLVMSFDALEHYYEIHGREWERYALIKARVVAGDRAAGEALTERLRPFVFRRYLDYGVFASLRDMKALINRESERKGLVDNIKLGPGGIREVEFVGQVFQLIRGGRDPALQERGIREVLSRLVERGLLPEYAERQLQEAYVFLRRVENRLQMAEDQQTHALPSNEQGRLRLADAMGFADWPSFHSELERQMRRVHSQFSQVFGAPQVDDGQAEPRRQDLINLWYGTLSTETAQRLLEEAGFEDPGAALEALDTLRDGRVVRALSPSGRERLDHLIPLLIGAVGHAMQPHVTLKRVLELLSMIARRTVYLSLLTESPMALSQLVRLCAASPWVASHLAKHPLLLDELLDPRRLYTPLDRAALDEALRIELERVDHDDLEQLMDRLRHFKEAQVLRVAAADVMQVLPLMKVSDQLTWIAEAVLEAVIEVARRALVAKHGVPRCVVDGTARPAGFGIVAYGKLAGLELGYGSDLDIVFLHDSAGEAQQTDGDRVVDNAVFFARLAQKIIHILTAFTPAGTLYEVDTRLRPSGASGLLVSSLTSFEQYQRESAWTWEHQALVRARGVAGDHSVAEAFERVRRDVLQKRRDTDALRRDVREMRERMWAELGSRKADVFDLKRDPGGIADIEFMVQYEVLAHACDHPPLTEYPDNIRILERLKGCDLLSAADAQFLTDTYRAFRDRVHALTLQERPGIVPEDEFADERREVKRIWREIMEA